MHKPTTPSQSYHIVSDGEMSHTSVPAACMAIVMTAQLSSVVPTLFTPNKQSTLEFHNIIIRWNGKNFSAE